MEGDEAGSSSLLWRAGGGCLWAESPRAWLLVYPPAPQCPAPPQLLDPGALLPQQGAPLPLTDGVCCETTFIEGRGQGRIPSLLYHISDDDDDGYDGYDDIQVMETSSRADGLI